MKLRYVLLAFLLCFLVTLSCVDKNLAPEPIEGTIQGQVTADGEGIGGVTVTLSGSSSTTTDASGNYNFPNVEEGTHVISISGFPANMTCPRTALTATISTHGQTVEANFACSTIDGSVLTVFTSGNGSGTVTSNPEGINTAERDPDKHFFSQGIAPEVTLTAEPDGNSIFTGWFGDRGDGEGCSESDPEGGKCKVKIENMDLTIEATFEKQNTGGTVVDLGLFFLKDILLEKFEAIGKLFNDGGLSNQSNAVNRNKSSPFISQQDEVQFGDLTGTFPVTIAGAEGFVVVDLLTGDVLFDATDGSIEGPPLFGVIGLSEEPPSPNSAHAFYYFGENGINAFDTQGECCTQQANQPPAFDAVPAGGNLYSGYAVSVATDGVNFIFYDEQQDLYRQTFFSESGIPANRFSGQPISAWMPDDGTPEDTPVLVLTRETESGVYLANRDGSAPVRAIDNIGFDARKLRCIDDGSGSGNLVCAASIFGHDRLGLLTWDGENQPTLTDFAEVGDGPVGIDMRLLENGNIAVVSTGFNDNTVTVTIVAPNGIVQSSNTQPVLEGCQSPGHAIFVQDAESLKNVVTCFDSSNYAIMESGL